MQAVGIEGTSSYGAAITAAVSQAGIRVVEVNRTRPAERRKQGKSDRLDAYRAARSVLSGEASTDPKRASIEPLRALMVARRSAVKAQQAAWRQIQAVLVNAPAALRDHYRSLSKLKLVASLSNSRPDQKTDAGQADIMYPLRALARRHRDLAAEIDEVENRMAARATTANPGLMALKGVGAVVGAQLLITAGDNPDRLRTSASFAALCGTAPIPVSSGRTDRPRLSRGGDRQAKAALHHIVKVRLSYDTATQITATPTWTKDGPSTPSFAPSNALSPGKSFTPSPASAPCPTTPTCGRRGARRISPSPPPRSIQASGHHASANSNSDNAPTTNLPTAIENGSTPLDTQ